MRVLARVSRMAKVTWVGRPLGVRVLASLGWVCMVRAAWVGRVWVWLGLAIVDSRKLKTTLRSRHHDEH